MREPTPGEVALSQLELTALGLNPFGGLKFGEPEIPQGKLHETKFHMQHRYEEGIIQLTKLLMRDGKLSKAQRVSGLHFFGPVGPVTRSCYDNAFKNSVTGESQQS